MKWLINYAQRTVGWDDAPDVVLQVFERLADKAHILMDHRSLRGWLFEATRRTALKHWKYMRRRQEKEVAVPDLGQFPMDSEPSLPSPAWNDIKQWFGPAVASLSPADQKVVHFRSELQLGFREIGQELGISAGTAETRWRRALKRLLKFFTKKGIEKLTEDALATLIFANAVPSPPAGVVAELSSEALARVAARRASRSPRTSVQKVVAVAVLGLVTGLILLPALLRQPSGTHDPRVAADNPQPGIAHDQRPNPQAMDSGAGPITNTSSDSAPPALSPIATNQPPGPRVVIDMGNWYWPGVFPDVSGPFNEIVSTNMLGDMTFTTNRFIAHPPVHFGPFNETSFTNMLSRAPGLVSLRPGDQLDGFTIPPSWSRDFHASSIITQTPRVIQYAGYVFDYTRTEIEMAWDIGHALSHQVTGLRGDDAQKQFVQSWRRVDTFLIHAVDYSSNYARLDFTAVAPRSGRQWRGYFALYRPPTPLHFFGDEYLTDVRLLANQLLFPPRPFDRWLADMLSPGTKARLARYQGAQFDKALLGTRSLLGADFRRLISGLPIYDSRRFEGIPLRQQTAELLELFSQGCLSICSLELLNRRLLEDAYPNALAKTPEPEPQGWMGGAIVLNPGEPYNPRLRPGD